MRLVERRAVRRGEQSAFEPSEVEGLFVAAGGRTKSSRAKELPYHIIRLPRVVTERYSSNVDMFWRPQDTDDPAHRWLRNHVRAIGSTIEGTEIRL